MVWMDLCFSSSSSLFVFCYYFFVSVYLILSFVLSSPFLFLMHSSSSCSLSGPCCMYWGGGEVWQRQIAQPQLKGDCLAPCSPKRWIIGIHHEQQHRSHGIDNNRWAATPEKKRGLYLLWKKKRKKERRGLKRESLEAQDRTRVGWWKRWRGTTQWRDGEKCWRASPLATEECTGGLGGHVNGGHLSLLARTFIPCSSWHPSHRWHKSWFLHNRSPFRNGGEECAARIDFSRSLAPPSRVSAQHSDA